MADSEIPAFFSENSKLLHSFCVSRAQSVSSRILVAYFLEQSERHVNSYFSTSHSARFHWQIIVCISCGDLNARTGRKLHLSTVNGSIWLSALRCVCLRLRLLAFLASTPCPSVSYLSHNPSRIVFFHAHHMGVFTAVCRKLDNCVASGGNSYHFCFMLKVEGLSKLGVAHETAVFHTSVRKFRASDGPRIGEGESYRHHVT